MKLEPIKYTDLDKKSREGYNFHKMAAILADYGYHCIWLSNDWNGADFIAVHLDGVSDIKVQLKGGPYLNKKFIGKNLYIGFFMDHDLYVYPHDKILNLIEPLLSNDKKWLKEGTYFQTSLGKRFKEPLAAYKVKKIT